MINSPDFETREQQVIKQQWQAWRDKLYEGVDTKDKDFDPIDYEFNFAIDRNRNDSFFTAEEVEVYELIGPLEEWRKSEPVLDPNNKEVDNERWIQINILPKNPYNPKLGIFSHNKKDYYYTEEQVIYLSDKGRAFEETLWTDVQVFVAHMSRPHYSYLTKTPKPEEIETRFTEEPNPDGLHDFTEHLQHMHGGSLERLDFLLSKINSGEIIEE